MTQRRSLDAYVVADLQEDETHTGEELCWDNRLAHMGSRNAGRSSCWNIPRGT